MTKSLSVKALADAAGHPVEVVKTHCSEKRWRGSRSPERNHQDVFLRVADFDTQKLLVLLPIIKLVLRKALAIA